MPTRAIQLRHDHAAACPEMKDLGPCDRDLVTPLPGLGVVDRENWLEARAEDVGTLLEMKQ